MPTKLTPPAFNVHSLLFSINMDLNVLRSIAQELATLGESPGYFGLEIACAPGMIDFKSGKELGGICVAENLPITALCTFFGSGDIDPLSECRSAMDRMEEVHQLATDIGEVTGITPVITGPWPYQIGKQYPRTDLTWGKVSQFTTAIERQCTKKFPGVRRAFEVLQPQENFAIQGHRRAADLLGSSGSTTGVQLDTFHLNRWGEDGDPAKVLGMFGDKLFWLHVSGQDRRTPGSSAAEQINWYAWAKAYNRNVVKPPICFEGFGPDFRAAVPEIGRGYPIDLPAIQSIEITLQTLRQAGFQI